MPISHKPDLNVQLIHLRFSPGFSPVDRLHLSLLSRSRAEAERISKTCLASQAAISWSRWKWNTQVRFPPTAGSPGTCPAFLPPENTPAPRAAPGVALAPDCSTAALSVTCRITAARTQQGVPGLSRYQCVPFWVGECCQAATYQAGSLKTESGSEQGSEEIIQGFLKYFEKSTFSWAVQDS